MRSSKHLASAAAAAATIAVAVDDVDRLASIAPADPIRFVAARRRDRDAPRRDVTVSANAADRVLGTPTGSCRSPSSENRGQTDRARALLRAGPSPRLLPHARPGHALAREGRAARAGDLRCGSSAATRASWSKANARATGEVNYLRGNDAAGWQTNLPRYGQIVYRDLWPGRGSAPARSGRRAEMRVPACGRAPARRTSASPTPAPRA